MSNRKVLAVLVASLFSTTQIYAQTPGAAGAGSAGAGAAGAGAATAAAVGGVTVGTVAAAVAAVAVAAAASSGSSGALPTTTQTSNQASAATAADAQAVVTQSSTTATDLGSVVTNTSAAAAALGLNADPSIVAAVNAANAQAGTVAAAQTAAANAAADLAAASNASIVGLINQGRTICAAATSCTQAEILRLNYNASILAKSLSDAMQTYNSLVAQAKAALEKVATAQGLLAKLQAQANYVTLATVLANTQPALVTIQKAAAAAINDYNTAQQVTGVSGTVITPPAASTGTTGSTGTR